MLYCIKKGAVNISVQILLATYNGEKYISSLLDSLINQTYQDFKIIANDDCSTDKTFDILKDYQLKFPDKIKVYQNENQSGSAKNNFFKLMEQSNADYIMFCDQDDIWKNDKIEKTFDLMKQTENDKSVPVLVHTDLCVVDENLKVLNASYFKLSHIKNETQLNKALVQNCVTGCSVMINKSLLNLAKNTNNENVIMHDWWIYLIASTFGKICFLNEQTVFYRQHRDNAVGAKRKYFLNKKEMEISVNKTINQCQHFFDIYKDKLTSSQFKIISLYSNIKKENSLKRLFILYKYKMLKRPLIKGLFQIIITMFTD